MNRLIVAVALTLLASVVAAYASGLTGGPVRTSGRQTVVAPIDRAEVLVLESDPPRYVLSVLAGLPSGCAERDRHEVAREGEVITVTIRNRMPFGDAGCTTVYGTYELTVDLGTDFRSGSPYTVRVNDRTTTFTAQ